MRRSHRQRTHPAVQDAVHSAYQPPDDALDSDLSSATTDEQSIADGSMLLAPGPDYAVADAGRFHRWTVAAERIRGTRKRLEKSAVLETYLPSLDAESLAVASRFFSGLIFPRHDMRVTQVGGSIVFAALESLSGIDPELLHDRYVELGDAGDLARSLFAARRASGLTLPEVERLFAQIAATRGSTAKRALVEALLAQVGGAEAQYIVKLLLGSGELRIGLKEAQVQDALAKAFSQPIALVRRATLLRGDIGETAVLAQQGALESASLALFHPIGFMLASPLPTADAIVAQMTAPFAVEHKYDGIRAQVHVGENRVAIFSRTLDEITHGYPDLIDALTHLPHGTVLDGELLAMDPADPLRAMPFRVLQRRLGRKAPGADVLAEVPAAFVAYDVLVANGELVIDEAYQRRRARLEAMAWPAPRARLAGAEIVHSTVDVERMFTQARESGDEGLIVKSLDSPYTPGRRGKSWVKLKKAEQTLDVVVVGAERGHGRRAGVLSDYTFAVRASDTDPALLTVGKAYNGLTDVEIAELTDRFKAITVEQFGRFHQVKPEVVLEVTFDMVQPSARHKSGYALRFPRIVRIRDDKPAAEVDTLATVKRLAGE